MDGDVCEMEWNEKVRELCEQMTLPVRRGGVRRYAKVGGRNRVFVFVSVTLSVDMSDLELGIHEDGA